MVNFAVKVLKTDTKLSHVLPVYSTVDLNHRAKTLVCCEK